MKTDTSSAQQKQGLTYSEY